MTTLMLAIYYASYLYFLAVPVLLFLLLRKGGWFSGRMSRLASVFALSAISVLAYARFVEPRLLLTKEHELSICNSKTGTLRLAVVADPQIGIFDNVIPMQRIVNHVEELRPDMLVMPGDFTYYLAKEKLEQTFAPLKELSMPVYAVMGNHDEGLKGEPDLSAPLTRVLKANGVQVLDGEVVDTNHQGATVRIIGMHDFWAAKERGWPIVPVLPQSSADLTFYLQHNPDVAKYIGWLGDFDLMISGHTHGGQVNLPFLTCKLTFACRVTRYGFKNARYGKVFVSGGTGMGGLPMRFNAPPVIDVLNISYAPCQ